MDAIPVAVIIFIMTAVIATVLSGLTWYFAKKSGLGDIQKSVNLETDRLVSAQRERIELLETQVQDLNERLAALEAESKKDKREISRLRKVIADRFLGEENK